MSIRDPIIEQRGRYPRKITFACKSRSTSRTSYLSDSAQHAYDFWAGSTTAGAHHKAVRGFREGFVVKTESALTVTLAGRINLRLKELNVDWQNRDADLIGLMAEVDQHEDQLDDLRAHCRGLQQQIDDLQRAQPAVHSGI